MITTIYAFDNIEEYNRYEEDIQYLLKKLQSYQALLVNQYQLNILPKTIIWTNAKNATTVFSKLPVPAFTNQETIYMTPSVEEWKKFYLSLFDGETTKENDETFEYIKEYFNSITIDEVFCILAHELTHHIDLFPDDFEDNRNNNIWFEEGMCEYLSQVCTLPNERYLQLRKVQNMIIHIYQSKYGNKSLDDFGVQSYQGNTLISIMLNYWRSSAAIHYLVENRYDGDILQLFDAYQKWHLQGKLEPLTTFFQTEHF